MNIIMTRGEWQTLYDSNKAFKTNTILYFVIKNLILSFHEQDKVFSSDLGSKSQCQQMPLFCFCFVCFNKTESAIELALWLRKNKQLQRNWLFTVF